MHSINGFVPAIVTPFDAKGEIQVTDFENIVRWFLDIGADGICIAGDNGESWALSIEERRTLLRAARKVLGNRVSLIFRASAATTKQSIQYVEVAAEKQAHAILVMPHTSVIKATHSELL